MRATTLRVLRAKYHISQADLAAVLGKHQSRISNIERGEARMSKDEAAAITQFFAEVKLVRLVRLREVNGHG